MSFARIAPIVASALVLWGSSASAAPLPGPRRSPDSQPQSGYALLPSRIRRHSLILIDARLSP
jgi:hypothetical protein